MGTNAEPVASPSDVPRATSEAGYEIELIATPSEMPLERANELNAEVAELAWRACGGTAPDEQAEQAVRAGWRAYCMDEGGRSQDYDRLVLVWEGERLVGFSGWVVAHMEPDVTLLWYKAAGTDPSSQGRGAFAAARDTIADLQWMTSFGRPTYFVMRTPNPLIYDTADKWWGRFPDPYERFFPKITPEGGLGPMDADARDIAVRIATALWPECEFDADKLVVKDFLGEYGRDIWRVPAPESPRAGTSRFFSENLRSDNEDALMSFCLFYE